MSALRYRADIDGLRSIAVLPVVAFHFGIAAAPGGFVGVDVFFVISGYLITSIIARECAEGRFSLLDFYERRARRILPALFAMIAAVVVIGWFLFLPREFFDLAKSVGAATVFLANMLFYLSAGYFDAASYTKPLLHTWSLGIEEQFYIVIPLLFMALAWMGWKATAWIAAITVASLALSVATTEAMPQAAYYLLPWRAWELGLGALLALGVAPPLRTAAAREAAAAIGVVLILGAVVLLDKSVPFPGWAALAPCLGAALLIHAGAGGTTRVGAVLASAVPVWIGKLSYSLYLWHWPVVVFFVYREMRMPTLVEAAVLFAVSLALAFASLKLVEQPFRRPSGGRGRLALFAGCAVAAGVLLAASGAMHLGGGFPGRLSAEAVALDAYRDDRDPRYGACVTGKKTPEDWADPCLYGAGAAAPPIAPTIALWGDSHASALIPALDRLGRETGEAVALYARLGCPPLEDFRWFLQDRNHSCAGFNRASLASILETPEIATVVLTMRMALYTEGWVEVGFGERGRRPVIIGTDAAPLAEGADRTIFAMAGLEATVETLRAAGKAVVLVYPIPEAPNDVPTTVVRQVMQGGAATGATIDRALFDRRNGRVIEAYDRLVAEHGLLAVRPHDHLCDATACRLVDADGSVLYFDKNHLSVTGAERLGDLFVPVLAGDRRVDLDATDGGRIE